MMTFFLDIEVSVLVIAAWSWLFLHLSCCHLSPLDTSFIPLGLSSRGLAIELFILVPRNLYTKNPFTQWINHQMKGFFFGARQRSTLAGGSP
ncbi:hypothetical protein, partial [Alkalicoccobacillus murimartini]|uniref:hypothetical protein n=1 Tax=Alkalicoccobacillus murimartini TaxID=171685 RepID=UPI0027D7C210